MADSPVDSSPAPETSNGTPPSNGTSPSNESSPPTPPSSPPPSSISAPPPDISASFSPPPAPPTQETSPPTSPSSSPPVVANPSPQTPENPSPPAPEGSTPVTPPAPPQTPSNQSPERPTPPSPGANDDRNRTNGGNNNRDGSTPSPPSSGNRTSGDGGSPSPPRSISPPQNSGDSDSSSGNHPQANIGLIIGVLVGAGLLLLLAVCICICCNRKKKKKSPQVNHMHYYNNNPYGGAPSGNGGYYKGTPQDHVVNMAGQGGGNWGPQQPVSGPHSDASNLTGRTAIPSPQAATLGHNQSTFTYDELSIATEGFAQSNLLGQGGFGYVHKGVLPSGKEVAVKSLKLGSGQGEREFQAEVDIISRVHHRHLVSLVGYCISGGQRLLVYEFIPNNTLEFHLHGKGRPVLDWPTRVKIALGSARGLAYLHEDCHPRIIHRDIKAANILLDFSFETKVADFGLAKLSQDNYTHVSTRVMGTFGYLAPEYASSGKLSDKSDVFSFGVMLLELITGRPPLDLTGEMEDSLVDWARPLCLKAAQDGDYNQLADPRLELNYSHQEMVQMASCAAAAIRHSARRRPKMSQIVRALEGDMSMDDLSEGTRPGQSTYLSPGSVSSEYDASSYTADMKKFKKLALENKEYQSSEYGGTSEYGLNPSASSSEEMNRGSMKRNPQL
ncbi:putative proline-rich receptor-like protein kinase PERK5 RLK-Pelle-PERK-1 family [Arabidopsis thaliana]|uniref:Proline-rich receptor-like protein kinase PERK5 n=4 Tax=Arabidopsis TaxID=3701 RepID=PERK5_ARATH|nr:Protein kinase superfamily protein [Arabidopsis thaliana]NP_195170.2 Protein kinase superfamily protein [Arabidopsis thaliana]Q8GX23.1 RecName: Full=Proline-rich receptor-like protein kinase PERK5; AltName: Full=Proline-rich extensin-like receptor kinase 5; Short=AtPERK5 [Arabidopsis thaliana]KAG7618401.1 Protein kinase-like domain superfamily [Arabidopsis thaliana x Arabidopsis arenosa]KAG7622862.1 Protein kinase-like domain superfamily [Arabidopsis suecica]AAO64890.1 At4g34440 [Arabidopsi|eukprot:NP_001320136.1 Protein kinase superfamily protein [Arabidopsis thaliana]